jgi:hypothetical protein
MVLEWPTFQGFHRTAMNTNNVHPLAPLINFQLFILDIRSRGGKGGEWRAGGETKNVKNFFAAMIKSIPSIFVRMRRAMGGKRGDNLITHKKSIGKMMFRDV